MSNKTYDLIKNTALITTPIIVFLSALCTIWNIPHAEPICASLAALDVLIGAIVVAAKKIYEGKNDPTEE